MTPILTHYIEVAKRKSVQVVILTFLIHYRLAKLQLKFLRTSHFYASKTIGLAK
uniref:Uncharacterized protein n=1 Tax=Hyaloperonospora arabidopsidis (strain Emoy2) TaxID=559515 RepID=M4BDL6_HYAAE